VEDLAITPDGRLAVSASWDKTLKVWDLTTGDCLHTLEGHTNRVPGVATTQDGRYAVSAAWDKTLKIWDLETGACLASFSGESAMGESGVKCAGITSDGLTIVAGDHGGAVYFLHFENAPINPLITIPDTKQNKDSSVVSGKTVEQIVRELGDFYARKEYDQATRLGKELEKKCRESGNKVYQQYALGIQADIQFAIGKKEEALILYKEREQICRDLGNKEMIQSSLGQQASILYTKKDYDSALSLWKEQEKICRESGNKVGLQRTLGNLAMILSERDDLGGAMALYKEQEQICTDLEDFEGKIIAVNKQLAISKKGKLKGMIKWIISNK
jgi:WD40 repeat protein